MVNFMCQIGWVTVLIHVESNIILDVFVRVYLPIILIFKFQGEEERGGTLKPPSGLTGSLFTPQVPFSHSPGAAPAAAPSREKAPRLAFGPCRSSQSKGGQGC